MSKAFKLATLAGAVSAVISSAAMAVNFQYDGWTVENGTIKEASGGMCAANSGFKCSVVASGLGFKQINVTEDNAAALSSGVSYIMTIVTDQGANGTSGNAATGGVSDLGFSDVSFVKMKLTLGGTQDESESGITARQRIQDNSTGKLFESDTDINTGWANTDTAANIVIGQSLSDDAGSSTFAGDDFSSTFSYSSNNDPTTGERTGFEMSIDQVARLASAATNPDGTDHASIADVQVFALREKQGDMLTTSSSDSNRNPGGIDLDGVATTPAVTWTGNSATRTGDDIKAIWIGQQINLGTSADLNAGSLGSSFGYLSFESTEPGTGGTVRKDSAFGFSASNSESAWEWDDHFM